MSVIYPLETANDVTPPPGVSSLPNPFTLQSSKKSMQIMGTGFKGEPVLNFDPPIWSPANYTVTVVSETELQLKLVDGLTWSKVPGPLIVKGINVGDGDVRRFPVCFFSCAINS